MTTGPMMMTGTTGTTTTTDMMMREREMMERQRLGMTGTTGMMGHMTMTGGFHTGTVDPYTSTKVYEFDWITPRLEKTVDLIEHMPTILNTYMKHGARPLLTCMSAMGSNKIVHMVEWDSFQKRVEARLAMFHDDQYRAMCQTYGPTVRDMERYLCKPIYYPVQVPNPESRILIRRYDFKGKPSVTAERFKASNDVCMPIFNQHGLKFIGLFKPIFAEKSNCLIACWEMPASVDPDVVRQVFLKVHQEPSCTVKVDKLWENIRAVSNRLYVPAPMRRW